MQGAEEQVQALFPLMPSLSLCHLGQLTLFFALSFPHIKWRKNLTLWQRSFEKDCQVPCKLQNQHLFTKGKPPFRKSVKFLIPSLFPGCFQGETDTENRW